MSETQEIVLDFRTVEFFHLMVTQKAMDLHEPLFNVDVEKTGCIPAVFFELTDEEEDLQTIQSILYMEEVYMWKFFRVLENKMEPVDAIEGGKFCLLLR